MLIVETRGFSQQIGALLAADAYRELQLALALRPSAGQVIPGGGGLRKYRWGARGQGKRGGVRVIYYWHAPSERILMLFAFAKNQRSDLSPTQLKALRSVVEMEYR